MLLRMELGTSSLMHWYFFFFFLPFSNVVSVCFSIFGDLFSHFVHFISWKVNELNNHFEKCQQLLGSISESLDTKAMVISIYLRHFIFLFNKWVGQFSFMISTSVFIGFANLD